MFQYGFTAEFGIMSIAVLTELLKTLVGKELLTPGDVRNVLQRAIHEISGSATEPTMRHGHSSKMNSYPSSPNAISRSAARSLRRAALSFRPLASYR